MSDFKVHKTGERILLNNNKILMMIKKLLHLTGSSDNIFLG